MKKTAAYQVEVQSGSGLRFIDFCYSKAELLSSLNNGRFRGKVTDIKRLYCSGCVKNVTATYFKNVLRHNEIKDIICNLRKEDNQ